LRKRLGFFMIKAPGESVRSIWSLQKQRFNDVPWRYASEDELCGQGDEHRTRV
jgi:hypothetical protein